MLAIGIREDLHQDERALLALDDAGHGPKRRASHLVACLACPSIARGEPVTASGSTADVLHGVQCFVVARSSDCDSENVIHAGPIMKKNPRSSGDKNGSTRDLRWYALDYAGSDLIRSVRRPYRSINARTYSAASKRGRRTVPD